MARTRLQGDFGKVQKFTLGTAVTTGTLTASTLYIVDAIGTSSALPSGTAVGYPFIADGTEDLTGSGGDSVFPATENDLCDISAWNMEFSRDEVEVTTLCDTVKKYLAGKTDVSGGLTGVYTLGITDATDGVQNNFVDIVSQADEGGTVTIDTITGGTVYLSLFAQKDGSSGETVARYIVPATLLTFNQGAELGSAQTFETSFRVTDDEDVNFCFYELVVA